MERIDMVDEFRDRDKWLDEGIQVVINDCEIIESFRAKPENYTDILKLPFQTDSVSNIEDTTPEGWDRKDIKKF